MTDDFLAEAPTSITIKAYYKGFSVLITRRTSDPKVELEKVMAGIDNMVERGFLPSWSDETNKQANGDSQSDSKPSVSSDVHMCTVHNVEMKERTSRDGSVFYSHALKKGEIWVYCSGKGFPPDQPTRVHQPTRSEEDQY